MIKINLDEDYVKQELKKKLQKRLDELQYETVFWDMKDLQENTRMSVNTMKDTFFYLDDFPKHKIGGKWYFPAEETKEFLLGWLKNEG